MNNTAFAWRCWRKPQKLKVKVVGILPDLKLLWFWVINLNQQLQEMFKNLYNPTYIIKNKIWNKTSTYNDLNTI
jgi:hypothetical protein